MQHIELYQKSSWQRLPQWLGLTFEDETLLDGLARRLAFATVGAGVVLAVGSLAPLLVDVARDLKDPSGVSLYDAMRKPSGGAQGPDNGLLPDPALEQPQADGGEDQDDRLEPQVEIPRAAPPVLQQVDPHQQDDSQEDRRGAESLGARSVIRRMRRPVRGRGRQGREL